MHTTNYSSFLTSQKETNPTFWQRVAKQVTQTTANIVHKITNAMGNIWDTLMANQVKMGIWNNIFSQDEIDDITLNAGTGRYRWYQIFSYGNVVGQIEGPIHSEVNWAILMDYIRVDGDIFPYMQVLELSDALTEDRKLYQLLTILKLIQVHWSMALHQSGPIRIDSWMLGLLRAHGINWKFDKNNWNETGIYIFSKG